MTNLIRRVVATLSMLLLALCVGLSWASTQGLALADTGADQVDAADYRELGVEERDRLYAHACLGAVGESSVASELAERYPAAELQLFQGEADLVAALAGDRIDYAFLPESHIERYMELDAGYECITPMLAVSDGDLGVQDYGALAKTGESGSAGLLAGLVDSFRTTFVAEDRWALILRGLAATCLITTGSFALGTLLAVGLCWLSRRKSRAARGITRAYAKLAAGIPVLVWLMILYYVVFASVDVPAVVVAVVCFGLQCAASIAEVFNTGLESVDKGQVEAATAMGFSPFQTLARVVLPQAATHVWPLYSGQLTALIKGTSIVGYIAIQDLTRASDIIRSRTFQAFFPLAVTAILYFALIALCGWALACLGRLLDPKRRNPARILKGVRTR